jgi:hypothetical protein
MPFIKIDYKYISVTIHVLIEKRRNISCVRKDFCSDRTTTKFKTKIIKKDKISDL